MKIHFWLHCSAELGYISKISSHSFNNPCPLGFAVEIIKYWFFIWHFVMQLKLTPDQNAWMSAVSGGCVLILLGVWGLKKCWCNVWWPVWRKGNLPDRTRHDMWLDQPQKVCSRSDKSAFRLLRCVDKSCICVVAFLCVFMSSISSYALSSYPFWCIDTELVRALRPFAPWNVCHLRSCLQSSATSLSSFFQHPSSLWVVVWSTAHY